MNRPLTAADLEQITKIIDSAFDLQHQGHADVFVDWMVHFGQLDVRIYWGKWSPSNEPQVFRYWTNQPQETRDQVYADYFKAVETFFNKLKPAQ
jgi:hypothetical protein